jgi:hypothetical protein
LPDDPGHFVAIELDDGVLHLDLGHEYFLLRILRLARALNLARDDGNRTSRADGQRMWAATARIAARCPSP